MRVSSRTLAQCWRRSLSPRIPRRRFAAVACSVAALWVSVGSLRGQEHAGAPAASEPFGQGRTITSASGHVLPERARAAAVNQLLRDRIDRLLPSLMRETGIDLWVVINREYAEDPVYLTLVPEPAFAARRTSMLVFFDRGPEKGVERLTVSRYALEGFYETAWRGGDPDKQWARLAEVIAERNPRRIGINVSEGWAFGDGLTAGLRDRFIAALPSTLRDRVVSAERLAVRWLETRTEAEIEIYPHIVALARGVISEAFSSRVIVPGITTADDVAWYIRQRFTDLGLSTWFMPSVDVQRPDLPCAADAPFCGESNTVIQRGDVLHCDVGITYLRLNTDTQEMGYVLRRAETDVPGGLKQALAAGNRWQDLLAAEFVTGRTGNEILARTAAAAAREGLDVATYSHPIGFHGHAAGTSIGLWDNQKHVPVSGEWPLHASTAYAIEGNVKVPVPEWNGRLVQIKLEQSAYFDGASVTYLAGRQTRWHLIE